MAVTRQDPAFRVLATSEELEAWTKGKILKSDPRVQTTLEAATNAVRGFCRWHIAPELTETLTLDGEGSSMLSLPTMLVSNVTAVRVDGVALATTDYRWSSLGNIQTTRTYGYLWPTDYRSIEVDLVHGYRFPPADVAVLTMSIAAKALASPLGATREQASSLVVQWERTGLLLTDDDMATLSNYRIP